MLYFFNNSGNQQMGTLVKVVAGKFIVFAICGSGLGCPFPRTE